MAGTALIFGKYELGERLAVGGMAEVFIATQRGVPGFERPVILKRMLPQLAAEPQLVQQFLDEARVAALLNHPNVVAMYEVGEWQGEYFLAIEFISGVDLTRLQRRAKAAGRPVPVDVAARIIHDAALGLDHAHQAKDGAGRPLRLVHRDVKPSNIMVRNDGVTKVVDFGIAWAANRVAQTQPGWVKGTQGYFAPEQLVGQAATPRSDQFALGIVAWELLTGRRLFTGDNHLETLRLLEQAKVNRPSAFNPRVAALDRVVMKMLAREQAERFETCGDVATAIDDALSPVTGWAKSVSSVGAWLRSLPPAEPTRPLPEDSQTAPEALRAGAQAETLAELPPIPAKPAAGAAELPPMPAKPRAAGAAELPPGPAKPHAVGAAELPPAPAKPHAAGAAETVAELAPAGAKPVAREHAPPRRAPSQPSAAAEPSSLKPLLYIGLFVVVGIAALAALKPRHTVPPLAAAADAGRALAAAEAGDASVVAEAPPDAAVAPAPVAAAPVVQAPVAPASPPDASVEPEPARYHVDSSPPGAWIFVDGKRLGSAPLVTQLAPGPHLLHAELSERETADLTVNAVAGAREDVVLALAKARVERAPAAPAAVAVAVSPAGAIVSLDGKDMGPAPITFAVEPDVPHQILARHAGYLQRGDTVTVAAGELKPVEIVLIPLR